LVDRVMYQGPATSHPVARQPRRGRVERHRSPTAEERILVDRVVYQGLATFHPGTPYLIKACASQPPDPDEKGSAHLPEGVVFLARKGLPAREGRRASRERRLDDVPGHWNLPHQQSAVDGGAAWREQTRIIEEA
jgi:hypothetical protein